MIALKKSRSDIAYVFRLFTNIMRRLKNANRLAVGGGDLQGSVMKKSRERVGARYLARIETAIDASDDRLLPEGASRNDLYTFEVAGKNDDVAADGAHLEYSQLTTCLRTQSSKEVLFRKPTVKLMPSTLPTAKTLSPLLSAPVMT